MNIFVLDTNPALAASYHCDQHLHKELKILTLNSLIDGFR